MNKLASELYLKKITKEEYEKRVKAEIQPYEVLKNLLFHVFKNDGDTKPNDYLGFLGLWVY